MTTVNVIFEYVWPDEDGDHMPATVNLETGEITLAQPAPKGLKSDDVRTRVWTGTEAGAGDNYDVFWQEQHYGGHWLLVGNGLEMLRIGAGLTPLPVPAARAKRHP